MGASLPEVVGDGVVEVEEEIDGVLLLLVVVVVLVVFVAVAVDVLTDNTCNELIVTEGDG